MFARSKKKIISNTSQGKMYLSALNKNFRYRLGAFRQNRTSDAQKALIEDFDQVLRAWGIENKADIPAVIRELRLRGLIFVVPIFIAIPLALFLQNFLVYVSLVCVVLPCLLGIINTLWRISILKHRHFVPLSRWLFALPFAR